MHGLKQKQTARSHYRQFGEQLAHERVAMMEEQLSKFRKVLEDFAFRHKEDIKRDPIFRKHFHEMCASIGVDPLASNKGTRCPSPLPPLPIRSADLARPPLPLYFFRRPGMWSELLGFGDFYYELGVQAVEACMAHRPANGGLMEIDELVAQVNKRRGGKVDSVSKDDVVQSIKKLSKLGSGFRLLQIGKRTIVQSVPGELNRDHNMVLSQAESQGGWVRSADIERSLGFTQDRMQQALQVS